MPFVLLLIAFLLYAQDTWETPRFGLTEREASLATLGGSAAFVLLAGAISLTIGYSLRRAPYDRYHILKRFARWRRWHFLAFSAFFVASLYVFGWGWALLSILGEPWSAAVKPLALAPYLGGLILAWGFFYDVDRAAHAMLWIAGDHPFPTRRAYLVLNVRYNLLLVAPPLALMVVQDLLHLAFPELRSNEELPYLTFAALVLFVAASVLLIPTFLRAFLGLTPLPAGELRDRLEAAAARLRFRASDILVWNTRGGVANAMVTGMLPIHRYVVLTDRLIDELSGDEIEGVFGHEVGHIKHHHMAFYSLFLLLSLVALSGLWSLVVESVRVRGGEFGPRIAAALEHQEWFLLCVVVYIFLVFGVLSRSCERQADLFGCNASSRDAFIRALEKVADINGMNREKPGIFTAWQHATIAQRVAFLRSLDADRSLEARAQRRIGLLKWSLTLGLLTLIAALMSVNPGNWMKYL